MRATAFKSGAMLILLQDPSSRKLKVLTIGAGLSGIQLAYQIQKNTQNVEHVIYEKNSTLGGTWLENRYPGKYKEDASTLSRR
jgi:cation diffusion facilitator CzcD-associated flavoprotein CzcO